MSLRLENEHLTFKATRDANPSPLQNSTPGAFTEGLWEGEVAELFLSLHGQEYEEWNLAPNGAWWTCRFSRIRERVAKPVPPEGVSTASGFAEHGWFAKIRIPIKALLGEENWRSAHMNLTAIIGGANTERQYLSLAKLPGAEPDYHQPGAFLPILLHG